jgi:hypothetical protein
MGVHLLLYSGEEGVQIDMEDNPVHVVYNCLLLI